MKDLKKEGGKERREDDVKVKEDKRRREKELEKC